MYKQDVHPERLNNQMRENSNNFDWSGIEFPVSLQDIVKFEKQNPYVINVLGYEKDYLYPIRISKKRGCEVIVLILLSNGETNHYCWVKNVNRLLSSQIDKNNNKLEFCLRCFNHFYEKKYLEDHSKYCDTTEKLELICQKIKMEILSIFHL